MLGMTAAEWLRSTDPQVMLEFVPDRAIEWNLRLLVIACCLGATLVAWPATV